MTDFFVKFFSGFAFWEGKFWGKLIFFFILFMGFSFVKNTLIPTVKRKVETSSIGVYNEAPDVSPTRLYGIRIGPLGLGITYTKE